MGIGTSKGAFYTDEAHYHASQWDNRYDDNLVSPEELQDRKDYAPPTIQVKNDLVPPNKMGITDEDIDKGISIAMGAGAGIIAGVGSATANVATRMKAAIDLNKGAEANKVFRETGWYKGSDGRMRYEISDEGMKLTGKEMVPGETGKLKDYIDHPELYKAYPEIGDINFHVAPKGHRYIGSFNSEAKTLTINPSAIKAGDEGVLDVVTHELQHVVQSKEGFSLGSNPTKALEDATNALTKKAKESTGAAKQEALELLRDINEKPYSFGNYMYLRAPGEVEANVVAARRKLSDEMRRMFPPNEMNKMFEGSENSMHGGTYQSEFRYPE